MYFFHDVWSYMFIVTWSAVMSTLCTNFVFSNLLNAPNPGGGQSSSCQRSRPPVALKVKGQQPKQPCDLCKGASSGPVTSQNSDNKLCPFHGQITPGFVEIVIWFFFYFILIWFYMSWCEKSANTVLLMFCIYESDCLKLYCLQLKILNDKFTFVAWPKCIIIIFNCSSVCMFVILYVWLAPKLWFCFYSGKGICFKRLKLV